MQKIEIKCKGAALLSIDTILDFQGKLKRISRDNLERLKVSILKNGFVAPIFIWQNESKSMALDGHQRIKALLSMRREGYEIPLLPVAYIQADNENDARQKLLAITSQYGEFDIDELNSWTSNIDQEIAETLRFANEAIILELKTVKDTIGDNEIELDTEPITNINDLWELGNNRLLCADSTISANVNRLMNDIKAEMIFTDPPYLMAFEGSISGDGDKSPNSNFKPIENDKLDNAESGVFLARIALMIKEYVSGAYYICFYKLGIEKIINALQQNGLKYRGIIIWCKNHFSLSGSDYQSIYEPIIYGWNHHHNYYGDRCQVDVMTAKKDKEGNQSITTQGNAIYLNIGNNYYKFELLKKKPANFINIREEKEFIFNIFNGENNVWRMRRVLKSDLHPTMKPLELCERAIMNSPQNGEIVLDLFLGSGTTLIACERTNRKCYGIEKDPHYCDVTVNRYRDWCIKNKKEYTIKLNGEPWQ